MDFLNKAYAQFSDLFRSMTPGARITSGLLLAVVVVSLGYLFTKGVAGPDAYLMGGRPFRPEQLDAMETAFGKAGLSGYKREGSQIRIPYGEENKYMSALAENDALPRDFGEIKEAALRNMGPFDSREKFKAQMESANQQQCSEILKGISWVADAAVIWDEKVKQGFGKENVITALASVLPRGSENMTGEQVQSIRKAVLAFRAGLKSENVTVVDRSNGKTYRAGDAEFGNPLDDPVVGLMRVHEEAWKAKILEALAYVPNVTVAVNVKLDPKRFQRQHEVKNDPKPFALQTIEKTRTKTQEGAGQSGRPGFVANQPGALAPAAAKGTHQEEEESETATVNARSGMTQDTEIQGLTPEQVTATIGIPMSYLKQLWQQKNPPDPKAAASEAKTPSQADLEQIRQQVTEQILGYVLPLIPDVEGVADKKELVRVEAFYDIAPPPIPEEEMAQKAMTWLGESWKTLGMILVVLISLLMLRSMIRAAPIMSENKMLPVAARKEPEPAAQQESAESEAARRLRRFQAGTSLKDELSVLVNDDPDAAANILRTWIGHPV